MLPKFLQLHYLTDYTAVLLNRDEFGAAKRLPKGEVMRTRMSSQAIKRRLRLADGPHSLATISPDAVRTKELADSLILGHLRQALPDADGEVLEAAITQLNIGLYGSEGNDPKKRQILLFGLPEIQWLQQQTEDAIRDAKTADDAAQAVAALFKGTDAQKNFTAFRTSQTMPASLTGALWGRMVTADPLARIDGAVHTAHAFTIHAEESEIDFFTAMDDLRSAQQAGSGYLSTTEINSGVFYFYIAIDVPQLVSNTAGCHTHDWQDSDRETAAQAAAAVAYQAATAISGAKKGSTAPNAYAQVLLAEFGERQPRSLAGAFTIPARANVPDGLRRMNEHIAEFDRMYGPHEARRLMAPGLPPTIDGIEGWIRDSIMRG